jgi:hypothetical protein
LIPRNIAARVKFPASATATKYCNSSNSIDIYPITNWRQPLERRRNSASPKAELRHRSLSELVAQGPLISFHPKTLRPSFSRDAAKSSQQRQRPDRRGDDIVARS